MEKVLNQEEIDAMVRAARGGRAGAAGPSQGPRVTPWDVRGAGQIGREQIRSITLLHEGFARSLTQSLAAYLRGAFGAALVSAEHLSYRDFLQRVPEVTYLASCKLLPMGVTAVLHLDLAVAFPVLDLLLGGEGQGTPPVRETTEIEEQILEGVVRVICRELGRAWQPLAVEFCFDQRQQTAHVDRLMLPEEKTLTLSFEITLAQARGTLSLAVPAVVSNALLRKISADLAYQKPRAPAGFREQWERRLLECSFQLDLGVTAVRVPLRQLLELVPGQLLVLRRPAAAAAALLVSGREMFRALVARRGTVRAAQLLERRPEPAAGKERR